MTYTVGAHRRDNHREDIRGHPLFANAPSEWTGSNLGFRSRSGMSGLRDEHGACDRLRFPPNELRLLDLLSDLRRRHIERNLHQIITGRRTAIR